MKTKNYIIYLILLVCLSPFSSSAQFTYIDLTVGNRFMTLAPQKEDNYRTRYNQTNIQVNGVWRIKRNLGVGMTASIPVRQGGKAYITTADNDIFNAEAFFSPTQFDYHFQESAKVAFNGRLYGGIRGSFYLDARVSIFTFSEHLMINVNSGGAYSSLSTKEINKYKQVAPGFSVGMNPHLSKNVYMNLNMSWDFYKFKDAAFSKAGPTETYNFYSYKHVALKTQLPEKRYAFAVNFGLGYFF